ncbi:MAG: glyoxalase [Saprospiraceae bacterium]
MKHNFKSIRPFIGAENFDISRRFYQDLGFSEVLLSPGLCYFHSEGIGFYLQNAYVKDWVDNTMVFMEVADVSSFYKNLESLQLPTKYAGVRLIPIKTLDWGSECFLHDPSGILWHFGEFAGK